MGDYRHHTSPTKHPRAIIKAIVREPLVLGSPEFIPLDLSPRPSLESDSVLFTHPQPYKTQVALEDYPPPPILPHGRGSPASSTWSLPGAAESPITPGERPYGTTSPKSPLRPREIIDYADVSQVYADDDQASVALNGRGHGLSDTIDNMLETYGHPASVDGPEPTYHPSHAVGVERRGFKGLFSAVREREKGRPSNGERERSRHRSSTSIQRTQWEMPELVGFITSTCVENWDDVITICDRVNQNDSEAKDACKALRRDIKFGLPPTQLSACRLWATLMQNCTTYFATHTTNRKFLGVIEDIVFSSTAAPVVRDRLVEVVGASVYLLRDSKNLRPYQSTWKKFRLQLKLIYPTEGLQLPAGDPFWDPILHERQSSSKFAPADTLSDLRIITVSQGPSDAKKEKDITAGQGQDGAGNLKKTDKFAKLGADIERILEESKVARHNCRILGDALSLVTPGNVRLDPVIKEFREKCMKSSDITGAQISWTMELMQYVHTRQFMSSGSSQVTITAVEQLLQALIATGRELSGALELYDGLDKMSVGEPEGVEPWGSQPYTVPVPDVGEPFEFPHSAELGSPSSSSLLDTTLDVSDTNQGQLSPPTPDRENLIDNAQLQVRPSSSLLFARPSYQDIPISRKMAAREVVSHLVAHGCRDLSCELDLSSFDEYPASHGGRSDIYQGHLLNGSRIAVKALRISADTISQDPKHLKHAARELHTWGRCRHPNVMPLLGLAIFRGRIGMVAPWMEHGNLPRYLERVPGVNRFDMCVQICEGLSYLHQIGIIHCDLKGANVLISEEGAPVLTDFGNSLVSDRTLRFTQTTSGLSFTVRWSAAEIIEETALHTESSDVYALGMETISGRVPYHGKSESNVVRLVTVKKELPQRPECMSNGDESTERLWKLLLRCWSYEPAMRPSAAEVTNAMKEITPIA